MSSWIEKKSAQLQQDKVELDKQAQRERKSALEKQIAGAATVDKLEMAVRRDIAKWNELNPNYRRRIDGVVKLMPSGAFRVSKTSFPPASVEAVLDPESFCVSLETTTVPRGEAAYRTDSGSLMLKAEKEGFSLTLQSGRALSFADASRVLLEPIIESIG